jgi:23S rRNA (cytidine1920-2'-O)/16S rRNA (cytidine1409-2'-O)-methyltransferase
MSKSKRADLLLVERGYFESRARAQAAIAAGLVRADGERVAKPSLLLREDAPIEAAPAHPYVSRGGVKLSRGLDAFGFDPTGLLCLDVGASTGGFTQVLLARGAARVVAVEVGHGQLHASLAGEPRLSYLERQDIRALEPARIGGAPALAVIDVSFIPLVQVLPAVSRLAAPRACLVALVKPQFEAGRAHVKKGIVRDPATHEKVCRQVEEALAGFGWSLVGRMPSPIPGGDGNREFLLGARRG